MEKFQNARRRRPTKPGEMRHGDGGTKVVTAHAHVIRLADGEARKRAILALGESQEAYCGFADYQFLVTATHLEILKKQAIPFELVS
jgi:hypothetical protein